MSLPSPGAAAARLAWTVLLALLPWLAHAYGAAGTGGGEEDRAGEAGGQFGGYVEAGAGVEGYDSPVLVLDDGGFIAIGNGRKRFSSPYYQAAAGIHGSGPVGGGRQWNVTADVEARRLPNLTALDEDRLDLSGALRWPLQLAGEEEGHFRLRLLAGSLAFDGGELRRHSLGWAADARVKPSGQESRTIKLEWRRLRHDRDNDLGDGDRVALSLGYSRGRPEGWAPLLSLRAGLSGEENRWGEDDLSYRRGALRAELSVTPRPGWEGSLALEARHTRYRAPEPGLDFKRRDRSLIMTLGIDHEPDATSSLGCELEWSRVDSNDALYAGDSQVIGCAWRLDY